MFKKLWIKKLKLYIHVNQTVENQRQSEILVARKKDTFCSKKQQQEEWLAFQLLTVVARDNE